MSACAGWKGGSPVSLRRLQISSGSTDRSLMLRPRASWRWQGWEFQTGKNSVRDALCGTPNPDQRLVDISFALLQRLFQPDIPILRCNIHPVRRFEFPAPTLRSEEHTSELQSLMRISYAVFCLQQKT